MWARGVAIRATATRGPVVRYDTVALASIALADFEQASNFVIRELGPLARKEEETQRLASTLMVYLEEGSSLDRAARRLGVHKNTVLNRVKRARELMGRGLDERNLELQVALAFARYLGETDDES
jgi:DNA-binding PucR family transcriptional regulator